MVENLTAAMREVEKEIAALRRAFNRRTFALVVIAVCMVAVVVVAARVQAENDRQIDANNSRWCPLVAALVLQSGDPKPTARGQRIIDWAADMRSQFHCPKEA